MVTVERIRDDSEKRILRCSEGNRVWYQMWINPGDMLRIELLLEGGSRTWMKEIMYSSMRERMVEGLLGRIGLRRYWIPFYRKESQGY